VVVLACVLRVYNRRPLLILNAGVAGVVQAVCGWGHTLVRCDDGKVGVGVCGDGGV